MNLTEERIASFREDAVQELMLEDQYNRHESHNEPDLDGCWLCRQARDEGADEAHEAGAHDGEDQPETCPTCRAALDRFIRFGR
jgi:rubrerythrin